MDYTATVRSAIEHAAPLVRFNGEWVPANTDGTIPVPNGCPHDYPIVYPLRDEIEKPHHILAPSPSDVEKIIAAYAKLTGFPQDKNRLDAIIAHEAEHHQLITQLGGSAVYNVVILANWEADVLGWTMATTNYGYSTTKIGRALTLAYPMEPSSADQREIQMLGYKNVHEVGVIAAQYDLPAPLSIKPRST